MKGHGSGYIALGEVEHLVAVDVLQAQAAAAAAVC